MRNLREILSLVIVAAMLCTLCFIGGVSADESTESTPAVVKEEGNFLLNGSFELAESKSNGETYGYKDFCANHGGTGKVADYWETFNWLNGNNASYTNVKMTHTTDAYTGDYALYWDIPTISGDAWSTVVYPTQLAVDTLPTGSYRLTAWVKGTNQASTITVTDANGGTMSTTVAATNNWKQISIDGITSIGNAKVNGNNKIGIVIKAVQDATDSAFIIDDIRLEAVEAEPTNYLTGGGFETVNNVWIGSNKATAGYAEKSISKDKHELIADGWRATVWDNTFKFQHTTDAHSGNYAIKVSPSSTNGNIQIWPTLDSLNTADITEGYYTLSVWVKSTNTSTSTTIGADYTGEDSVSAAPRVQIPQGTDWHKVTLYDIYLTAGASNLAQYNKDSKNYVYKLRIDIKADSTGTDYVIIDDITLTKQEPLYNGGMEIEGLGNIKVSSDGRAEPNRILQGFSAIDWSDKTNTYERIDTDFHSGSYALKITKLKSGQGAFIYDRNNANVIGAGTYRFSAWVKGTATDARLKVVTAKAESPETAAGDPTYLKFSETESNLSADKWQYYEYIFTIGEGYVIRKSAETKNGSSTALSSYYNSGLGFGIEGGDVGGYAIFDDVKLEKLNTDINVAQDSVIGIKSLKKGDTKLTLPDAGGYYNVSIAATSNTDLIALDGTVTPKAYRTQVDVTLKITNKKNSEETVELAPIGVVIPGTKQTEIDAVKYAIHLLPNSGLTPSDYAAAVDARELYNALSDEAKTGVTNFTVLNERDGVVNQYTAVIGETSLKDGKLRIKAAYPTLSAEGYTVKEYGMLFIPSALSSDDITLETENVAFSKLTDLQGDADTHFYSILNGSDKNLNVEILMRSYVTYKFGYNEEVTLYGRDTVKVKTSDLAQ